MSHATGTGRKTKARPNGKAAPPSTLLYLMKQVELAVRAEGPRILLDPALREMLATGGNGSPIEPRAAGAWLAHNLAAEGGGSIQLSDASSPVLMIGATLPA